MPFTGPDSPQQNRILAALSTAECARLEDDLEIVLLKLGQVLYEPGDRVDHAYFPTTCILSLMFTTENGSSAELAMTGNDGLIGAALVLGGDTTNYRVVVQSAGKAYRMRAEVMRWEVDQGGNLQRLVLRYIQALMTQMAQSVVCNRHHSVDQQLCRLLLLSLDRMPGNQLEMTQERIANMLGVRREGVTEAAGNLQAAGLIHYSRGHITVSDRSGLEARVCECYAAVKLESDRLSLPAPDARVRDRARPNPATLRRRAEARLQQTLLVVPDIAVDNTRLLHELQVHQIELEIQHEALRTAYAEADALRERYADIYDFAPTGYVTLDSRGTILDLNLAGAILLGITRSQRNRHRFAASVTPECVAAFNRFVEEVLKSKGKNVCEIALLPANHHGELIVRIEAVPDESGRECRMVLIDITAEKLAEKALFKREQYQRALLDNFPFMVWLKDEQSRFLAGNAALAAELGLPSAEVLVGKTDFDILTPERAEAYRAEDSAVLNTGETTLVEQFLEKDGKGRWLEVYKSPIRIDRQLAGTVGFARDVTQHHLTQQALTESERQYRRLMEKLPLSAAIVQDGILKYLNPKALELSGYSAEACIGQPFLSFIPEADRPKVLATHEQRMRGESAPQDYEVQLVAKGGRIVDCHGHFSMVRWDERIAMLGIFEDVTEQNRTKAELQSLESTDLLTHLANRRHFIERMEEALSQVHRAADYQVALLVIGLEHFAATNATLGHAAGNAMLRLFSSFLRDQLRKADVGGRIGDHEFAVLLPGTDLNTASVFAERLRKKAAELSAIMQNRKVALTLSIGVSTINAADATAEQVLVRASEALQRIVADGCQRIEIATAPGAERSGVSPRGAKKTSRGSRPGTIQKTST